MEIINAIGRRKSAVARVYLSEGKGNIKVNNREYTQYFTTEELQAIVLQPLKVLDSVSKYDIKATIDGGGTKGQADAICLAIARALVKVEAENKPKLKHEGLMTRDPRVVERKKPGRPKARKRFQFSKR